MFSGPLAKEEGTAVITADPTLAADAGSPLAGWSLFVY